MAARWKPEEDALALDMRSRGKTPGQISFRVPRTVCAVASRLRYLELGCPRRGVPPPQRSEGRAL